MNKRGIAIVFGLLVVVVLSILSASFLLKTVNDSRLVTRFIASSRAFWLAEAGIAEAIKNLPLTTAVSGNLDDNPNYQYSAQALFVSSPQPGYEIYKINSTGSVVLAGGNAIDRKIEAFVSVSPAEPGDFAYAIEVNGNLKLQGDYEIDPPGSYREYANLSFADRFNLSSEEVKNIAIENNTYYVNPPSPLQNLSGITWIDILEPENQLKIPRTGWEGSGILIVNGDTDIEGGTFNGIIWVIGKLTITGNATLNGAVLSECNADVTTKIAGTPTINWRPEQITNALNLLRTYSLKAILSWREI